MLIYIIFTKLINWKTHDLCRGVVSSRRLCSCRLMMNIIIYILTSYAKRNDKVWRVCQKHNFSYKLSVHTFMRHSYLSPSCRRIVNTVYNFNYTCLCTAAAIVCKWCAVAAGAAKATLAALSWSSVIIRTMDREHLYNAIRTAPRHVGSTIHRVITTCNLFS